jgi:hypothetical protein
VSDEVKVATSPETFEWMKILIPTIVAFIAGAFGSVIAPWANWGIKKKEILLNNRKQLIDEVRNKLSEKDLSSEDFINSQLYSKIRPFLKIKTIDTLEKTGEFGTQVIQIQMGGRGNGTSHYFNNVLDDIQIKEKEWGLI